MCHWCTNFREEKDVSDDTDGEKTDHAEKENSNAAENESTSSAEDAEEVDENVELKSVLKSKIPEATDEDVDDLAEICREYFTLTNSKHKINHSDSNQVGSKTTNTFSEDCPEIKDESNDHEDAKKSKEKEPTEGKCFALSICGISHVSRDLLYLSTRYKIAQT